MDNVETAVRSEDQDRALIVKALLDKILRKGVALHGLKDADINGNERAQAYAELFLDAALEMAALADMAQEVMNGGVTMGNIHDWKLPEEVCAARRRLVAPPRVALPNA